MLAMLFHWRPVPMGAAFVRAIHELFWALLFMQVFGRGAVTGLLAIAAPFAGIFVKVYAEILEESDEAPVRGLPAGSPPASAFVFARLPDAWAAMKRYTYYRLECGLRSSAVLGFVGLPTLGFFLESAFAQGYYSQAGAYLLMLHVLIASLRLWMPANWWCRPLWRVCFCWCCDRRQNISSPTCCSSSGDRPCCRRWWL